jgi:hypothetical protein
MDGSRKGAGVVGALLLRQSDHQRASGLTTLSDNLGSAAASRSAASYRRKTGSQRRVTRLGWNVDGTKMEP